MAGFPREIPFEIGPLIVYMIIKCNLCQGEAGNYVYPKGVLNDYRLFEQADTNGPRH